MTKETILKNLINSDVFMRVNWIEDKFYDLTGEELFENISNLIDNDTDEAREVFEWYAVSDWLFDELNKIGSVTLDVCELDMKVWGRCETGQSLTMDHDLNNVATELSK